MASANKIDAGGGRQNCSNVYRSSPLTVNEAFFAAIAGLAEASKHCCLLLLFSAVHGRAADLGPVEVRVDPVERTAALTVGVEPALAAGWVKVTAASRGGESWDLGWRAVSNVPAAGLDARSRRIEVDLPGSWVGRRLEGIGFRVRWKESPVEQLEGMVWIEPGTFRMGSPSSERDRGSDEGPQTEVRLTQGFFLGKYELTQGEWTAVMGSNPSHFKGDARLPVEQVSWEEAMEYCRRLTERERQAGRLPEKGWEYRLPTEVQWEYACRAGTMKGTAYGDGLSSSQANFDGNYPYGGAAKGPDHGRTVRVGSYAPNAWGLYDMHGNVWEWCLDWHDGRLPGGSVVDPSGPKSGSNRVSRGGGWSSIGRFCRSANRDWFLPGYRDLSLGFRSALVRVP